MSRANFISGRRWRGKHRALQAGRNIVWHAQTEKDFDDLAVLVGEGVPVQRSTGQGPPLAVEPDDEGARPATRSWSSRDFNDV